MVYDEILHHEHYEARDHEEANDLDDRVSVQPIPGAPRKDFRVPVHVAVERPNLGPLIVLCDGDGGVQGLKWYAKRFRVDEDGDVGDEFLDQVSDDEPKPLPNELPGEVQCTSC